VLLNLLYSIEFVVYSTVEGKMFLLYNKRGC